ncbi:MAG: hypothetical protein ACREQ9_18870 [Candidatus Binatia bacterium]
MPIYGLISPFDVSSNGTGRDRHRGTKIISGRTAPKPEGRSTANRDAQPRFNDFIREIGAEEGALVIDLVRFLEAEVSGWNEPMKIFYDGMHVTDEGSRAYATHIAERLATEVLSRERTSGAATAPARRTTSSRSPST